MDSDEEYTTDEGKRKKTSGNLSELFGRSVKTKRTPDKREQNEDKLELIIKMIADLKTEIKQELRGIREEQKECKKELIILQKANENFAMENKKLKEGLQKLSNTVDILDREKRRNNIVIQGMPINTNNENELKEDMEVFIRRNMEVEAKIRNARKIGEKTCLVELENATEKFMIMKNKNKLKEIKEMRIFINDDMSKEQRNIQKSIRAQARDEIKNGKTVKIGYRQLTVDNVKWIWSIEKGILENPKGNDQGNSSKNE